MTLPSILLELNRLDEAEEIIIMCKKIGGKHKLLLHGYLALMHASKHLSEKAKVNEEEIKLWLKEAHAVFEQYSHAEG